MVALWVSQQRLVMILEENFVNPIIRKEFTKNPIHKGKFVMLIYKGHLLFSLLGFAVDVFLLFML